MADIINMPQSANAIGKLEEEYKQFKGNQYAKAIAESVYKNLKYFCEQYPQFAIALASTKRTLSDVCFEVCQEWEKKHVKSISDFETYEAVLKNYFPNATLHFKMQLELGELPTTAECERKTEYPKEKPIECKPPVIKAEPKKEQEPTLFDMAEEPPKTEPTPSKPKETEKPKEEYGQMFLFDMDF